MPSPSLLQTLRTPWLWRRRLRDHQQQLVFLRVPHCGGRSIVQALEAAGHTVARTRPAGSPANQTPTPGPAREAAEAGGLDFSQLSDCSDAELQQLILPKGSTLTCLSYSLPPPGVLARCCPGARVFSVVGDPVGRLVVAYRSAVLQGDPTAAGCRSLADFIEQNSRGVAAGDRLVRMLCDPRPIAASSDWSIDALSIELAFDRLTVELDSCFLLEQPLVDLKLGQWLQLPGGRLSPWDHSSFSVFKAAVHHSDRSAQELEELLVSIRVTERCLALARLRNQHDSDLLRRLAGYFGGTIPMPL